ncbi:hypothetical protein DL546_004712 [Coniochaeta pulveracea]|uniref:Uncharacterized protein n=1 Tax=Coniochaeta pulveracea TaxID=177199 RepID=A0A420Y0D0_9PEZI|nr:hypothetical protein DL546_004712 [Coniochaeta pulveracea]
MLSTREEIKSALDAYHSYIAANSRRALETLIPIIANWVPAEDDDTTEKEVPLLRLKSLNRLVDYRPVIRRLSDPTEVLTRWDELVPLLELDGVRRFRLPGLDEEEDEDGVRHPLAVLADQEYRELKFNEYIAVVEAALKDRVLEEARGTVAFPEELRILFELGVDGLNGIGLQIWRGMFGCAFWDGLGQGNLEDVASRVQVPDTKIEDEKQFAWRYTTGSEYGGQIFDTIPQLLDYYQGYEQYSMDYYVGDYANEEDLFPPGLL